MGLMNLFSGQPASPGTSPPPQGLLDLLLGQNNPLSQFADSRQNVMGAIGSGLASGPTFSQGMANAAQNVPQARKADYQMGLYRGQVSQTVAYLQKTHPDLAQAVQSGTLSPADAFNMAYQLDNAKLTPTDPWQVMRNPQTGEIKGQAVGGSDSAVDPKSPPMGQAVGNPVQLQDGRWAVGTSMGGLRYIDGGAPSQGGPPPTAAPSAGGFDQFGGAPAGLVPNGAAPPAGGAAQLPAAGASPAMTAPAAGGPPTIKSPAQIAAETAAATERAKALAAKPEQRVAAETAMAQLQQSDALNKTFIQTAIKQADDLGATGWAGKLSEALPGTPAYKLAKTLDTVKANIGFDKLQAMRAASPSGGALGQISNFEEQLLQSVQGSLDQGQDAATIKANLTRLLDYMDANDQMRQKAFQQDFGGAPTPYAGGSTVPAATLPGQAAVSVLPGEQTATNPQTGQKAVYRNGQWMPVQ